MNKRVLTLLMAVILMLTMFVGCGNKATSPEVLKELTDAGFPMELIPEGVAVTYKEGVVTFTENNKDIKKYIEFYEKKIEELGGTTLMTYTTEEMIEAGMMDPTGYNSMGLEGWFYNGLLDSKTLMVSISEQPAGFNKKTTVYLALDEIDDSDNLISDYTQEETMAEITGTMLPEGAEEVPATEETPAVKEIE